MNKAKNGNDFDWVRARANCTIENAFKQLHDSVIRDYEQHLRQNPELAQGLELGKCSDDKFFVKKDGVHIVVFELAHGKIRIERVSKTGETEKSITISVSLNDDGECVLKHGEGIMYQWQVRRSMLENTFFG